jgi:hypothetical protein
MRPNDFNSGVATLLMRWNACIFIYTQIYKSIYGIHHFLLELQGSLILFVISSLRPSTSVYIQRIVFTFNSLTKISTLYLYLNNTSPLLLKLYHICKQCFYMMSRYPLYLIKMTNTGLTRLTATAGTRISRVL